VKISVFTLNFIFVFPYHFFGLDKFFYFRLRPRFFEIVDSSLYLDRIYSDDFYSTFPGKNILFLVLILILLLLTFWIKNKKFIFPSSIFLIILWFNTDFSSPLSWVPSFEKKNFLYGLNLWDGGIGFSNADDPAYSGIVEIFQTGFIFNTMLIRRPFFSYFIAQLSFFTHSYHIWILLNFFTFVVFLLTLSKILIYFRVDRKIEFLILMIASTTSIFISYAGNQSYVFFKFFAPFFSLVLFVLISKKLTNEYKIIIFGIALFSCLLLTYDYLLWVFVILLYGYYFANLRLRNVFIILCGSCGVYASYIIMNSKYLKINILDSNSSLGTSTLAEIFRLINSLQIGVIHERIVEGLSTYSWVTINSLLLPLSLLFLASLLLSRGIQIKKYNLLFPALLFSLPGVLSQILFAVGDAQEIIGIAHSISNQIPFILVFVSLWLNSRYKDLKNRIFIVSALSIVLFYQILVISHVLPSYKYILFKQIVGINREVNFDLLYK
jgi:hypothetical protein